MYFEIFSTEVYKRNVGETFILCDPLLCVRPRRRTQPEYPVDLSRHDPRDCVRPGVRFHLEGSQAHDAEVLKTDSYVADNYTLSPSTK